MLDDEGVLDDANISINKQFVYNLVYAPTSTADEEEMDYFFDALQKAIDITPKGDIMYVIGD